MSASDGVKQTAAQDSRVKYARLKYLRDNAVAYFTLFGRKPRRVLTKPAPLHVGAGILGAVAMIMVTMMVLDARSISVVARLPQWLIASFDRITDFGNSVRFLVPIALVLAVMAGLASPALPAMSRRVLAAVAVRLGFLFSAIALPGLVVTIVKRLIGRARPLAGGSADPFLYFPLDWKVEYASFPSGHATDAFAAATAIGALWPQARPWMWTYAVIIAVSRVVLTAHFPSDVLAGAIVGVTGAVLVRAWFASRGLAFASGDDGRIRPLPGPSFARVKRVARARIAP
jgi:membrane-associated phospholipid phosphatase